MNISRPRFLLSSFFLMIALTTVMQGQIPDTIRSGITTEGKEFYITFQKNFRDYTSENGGTPLPAEALTQELFITSNKLAKGYIEVKGIGFRRDFTINPGTVENIKIDTAAQVRSSEKIEDLGVHIVSDQEIAVYGLSTRFQTTDSYLAYPVAVLGTSYRVVGYKWLSNDLLSQFAVIATEDNTRVTIVPNARTLGDKPAGTPFSVTLNKGQVYQVIPKFIATRPSDLTGSFIQSDKPIAVFSGHNCAYVPDVKEKACNILIEQMPPLQSWGRQFFIGTLKARASSVIRVVAAEDSTEVFENNSKVATLKAGEFYENPNLRVNTMLTSSRPILVAQYSKGFAVVDQMTGRADSVGDPMMIIVAPTEQFLASYRFATPVQGAWQHYINVIVPTDAISSMRLNGQPIRSSQFEKFGISRYSIAQLQLPYGTYSISASQPFGLYSYGFGYADKIYDAYGNGGGQSMIQIVEVPDRVPPTIELSNEPITKSLIGVIRDDRVNDRGLQAAVVTEFDNLKIDITKFELGAQQTTVQVRPIVDKQNAYARVRMTDRAGNESLRTVCLQYDEFGDTMIVQILDGDQLCSFAPPLYLGGFFNYRVIDNNVLLEEGSEIIDNPVVLKGTHGAPNYSIGAFGIMPWKNNIQFTGRAGLDFFSGDAYGYWPDSLKQRADDGTLLNEEFQLHRTSTILNFAPGIRIFPFNPVVYAAGSINFGIPLGVTERYTRTVQVPANYVYSNGSNILVEYEGDGPSGFPLTISPEAGIGAEFLLDGSLTINGEIGAGFSLGSIAPGRDWKGSWLFGRIGVTKILRL